MAITLKDVAKATGVSTAAASMALNGKPGVSEATREEVLAVAERLGYRPNHSGRALRLSRTNSIGIYTPASLLDYSLYYGEVTKGVVAGLADTGLSPVMLPSIAETGDLAELPQVDGYIIVEPHSDDLGVNAILASDAPTVCIDPPPGTGKAPWGTVEANTAKSTTASLDLMLQRGSVRPGVLIIETVSQWTADVTASYRSWCDGKGIVPAVVHADLAQSNDDMRATLLEALDGDPGCDGLFICGDTVAARIAGVLRSLGRPIGDQMRLVSGVDSPMMEYHTPPITSIDMRPIDFGQRAAEMMRDLLAASERPATPLRAVLDTPLIPRAT